jgi:hypothetical protein
VTHIEDVIDRFVQAGSANKGKTSGRFPEFEETAFCNICIFYRSENFFFENNFFHNLSMKF